MKALSVVILTILTLLAVSSGITKILLMQHELDFFGKYGFSSQVLVAFGSAQLLGGLLLVFPKTRFFGAAIVAFTFLVSLAMLLMDGNIATSIITLVAILLLGLVMKQGWPPAATN